MDTSFRHKSSFGKRIEHFIISKMLKEGLDVYIPLVDDMGIDAVVRRPDGSYIEIQVKARSKDVKFGDAALFSAIPHEYRANYWFVFYSERMDMMWILNSEEFIKESHQNVTGKNIGKRIIWFNGKNSKQQTEHCHEKFQKYISKNFSRLLK